MKNENFAMNTLDQIPKTSPDAKQIIALQKRGGKVVGYKLSDQSIVSKEQAVSMAKQGKISGVGIAHRKDSVYLKSLPNGSEKDNLGNLPSITN